MLNRHRAGGDVDATAILFEKIINEGDDTIHRFLKRGSKEQALPPNMPREEFDALPGLPGVYYFLNKKGKVVYVGKAVDIKKRVSSHFSNNSPAKQKGDFMRHVFHVHSTVCSDENMALALETREIKRLWPTYNRAQKGYVFKYGIVSYVDQSGYCRIAVKRIVRKSEPHIAVESLLQGQEAIRLISHAFNLCLRLSGIPKSKSHCREEQCVCCNNEMSDYNERVIAALAELAALKNEKVVVETPPVYGHRVLSMF